MKFGRSSPGRTGVRRLRRTIHSSSLGRTGILWIILGDFSEFLRASKSFWICLRLSPGRTESVRAGLEISRVFYEKARFFRQLEVESGRTGSVRAGVRPLYIILLHFRSWLRFSVPIFCLSFRTSGLCTISSSCLKYCVFYSSVFN